MPNSWTGGVACVVIVTSLFYGARLQRQKSFVHWRLLAADKVCAHSAAAAAAATAAGAAGAGIN